MRVYDHGAISGAIIFTQVYKGLDILTAKATKEEQAIAPHHLLDMYDPLTPFSVIEFRNRSLALVSFSKEL